MILPERNHSGGKTRHLHLNMEQKILHPDFIHDTDNLLRPGVAFDIATAYAKLDQDVLALI